MRVCSYFLILIFITLSATKEVKCQFYTIPDANFRNYLVTQYPTVMNGSQQLIIANAKLLSAPISCVGLNISDFSGLDYFYNATMINCDGNPISSLPSLDSMNTLRFFWAIGCNLTQLPPINQLSTLEVFVVKGNQLTNFPSLTGLVNLNYLDCSNNLLTSLPSLAGLTSLKDFYCYNNQLTQLPSLNGLSSLERIDCPNNLLTSLPDFSSLTQLKIIRCSQNKLTSLPSLSTLPNLIELSVDHNKLSQLPDISFANQLKIINVSTNQLTDFPDISAFANLTSVAIQNNQLSFQDILPQTAHPSFSSIFQVSPQDTLLNYPLITLYRNAPSSVIAGVDAGIVSNSYTWYKDENLLSSITESILLSPPSLSDEGYYLCTIKNSSPLLASLTIVVKSAKVTVSSCFNAVLFNYTMPSNLCMEGALLEFNESSISSLYKPFNYLLLPLYNQNTYYSTTTSIKKIEPGKYDLKITDVNNCSLVLKEFISIPVPEDCDNIITPNGDGIDDSYFISKAGKAKVYSKAGLVIKEFSLPNHWDATDASGKLVPMGYYVILINDKEKIGIIVLE